MKMLSCAALLLLPLTLAAQPAPLLNITDPEADDIGAGALVYPGDSAYSPGDLDLRSLRAFAENGGVRFEATFRNLIRHPSTVHPPGPGSEDLSAFARHGFYTFNLDLYIDTDRVPGSGNTFTLPGRGATVAAASAWERAIVLTPRPELMRRQFIDLLEHAAPGEPGATEAQVDRSVFFVADVRIRGRSVSFFVPDHVIDAATLARSSIVAFVTAAKLSTEAETNLFSRFAGAAATVPSLGVARPEAGRPQLAMGYGGDRAPPTAVVDLLTPQPSQQTAQLTQGVLQGLNRENRYGAGPDEPMATPATAAVDAGAVSFSRALTALVRGETNAAAAAPAPTPAPPVPVPTQAAATPALPAAPSARSNPTTAPAAPAAVAPPPRRPHDAAFYEEQEQRLRALKRLRESNLITEDEYQLKRRQVLDQL